jgi:hypothetical protein
MKSTPQQQRSNVGLGSGDNGAITRVSWTHDPGPVGVGIWAPLEWPFCQRAYGAFGKG